MKALIILMIIILWNCTPEPQVPESVLEVPDPGSENNKTLAGIDSDSDGIRDDVQRWINRHYYKEPNKQNALKQIAKYVQLQLVNIESKELSIKYSYKIFGALRCHNHIFGILRNNRGPWRILKSILYNTRERNIAYSMSDKHFHGQTGSGIAASDWYKSCEFKIERNQ